MAQIIVNPRQMVAFSHELGRLIVEMKSWEAELDRDLKGLKSTWNDDRYARFNQAVTTASVQLQIFYNRCDTYTEYLCRKAAAAERYLNR